MQFMNLRWVTADGIHHIVSEEEVLCGYVGDYVYFHKVFDETAALGFPEDCQECCKIYNLIFEL